MITSKSKLDMFNAAAYLVFPFYGPVSSNAMVFFNNYFYGDSDINELKTNLFALYFKSSAKPISIFEIKKNPTIYRYLLSSFITLRIMDLDSKEVSFNISNFKDINNCFFQDIFNQNDLRKDDFQLYISILNDNYAFLEHDKINENLHNQFTQFDELIKRNLIDKSVLTALNKENISDFKWESFSKENMCSFLSSSMGNLWHIHPFFHGNMITSFYIIIRLFEYLGYKIDRSIFKNSINPDTLIKSIIVSSNSPQFLYNIFMYGININSNNKNEDKKRSFSEINNISKN